jgi:hypothetical protein
MPTIANGHVVGSGELTSDSSALVDALCTSAALANGVPYFVFGQGNYRNNGGATWGCELEGRLGTTRIGRGAWRSQFGQFNVGDDVGGGAAVFLGVVTGDGTSTLNMRAAGLDNAAEQNILVGGQSWVYFSLEDFTEGSDYAHAQLGSDAASVTPDGSTWVEGDADGQVEITPTSTGDWLILAVIEALPEAAAAATNEIRARLRQRTDPNGTPSNATIGSGEQYSEILGTDPDHFAPTLFDMDVVTLTGGTTYRFLWEVQNATANDEIGYRRERIVALRLGAFRNVAFITDAGGMTDVAGAETPAASGLTHNFSPAGGDVLVLGNAPTQNDQQWTDMWLRREGTPDVDIPGGAGAGRMHAMIDTDFPDGDIVNLPQSAIASAVSGSTTWRLVLQADGAPGGTYGRVRGDSDDARSVLIALEMFAVAEQFEFGGTVETTGEASVGGGPAFTLFSDGVETTGEATVAGAVGFAFEGTSTSTGEASVGGSVAFALGGTVTVTAEATVAGGAAFGLGGTTTSTGEATIAGAPAFSFGGTVTSTGEASIAGEVASNADAIVGAEGQPLELQAVGLDQYKILPFLCASPRPFRFNLLSAAGTAVDADMIVSITARVKRVSSTNPASVAAEVDEAEVGDVAYGWSLDLSAAITAAGRWALELDVVLVGGTTATWPSTGPLWIRAHEGVG